MDPTTAAAVIAGLATMGRPAAELVRDLVGRILGPAADASGDALKEWLDQRTGRATDTLFSAGSLLHGAKIEPQPVPGRLLWPILEYVSLQDQPELRHRWAALLANAANPVLPEILPAYVDILRQLTSVHVALLDCIHGHCQDADDFRGFTPIAVSRATLLKQSSLDVDRYQVIAADMHRMRLVDARRIVHNEDRTGQAEPTTYEALYLTPLGLAFMEACRAPSAGEVTEQIL